MGPPATVSVPHLGGGVLLMGDRRQSSRTTDELPQLLGWSRLSIIGSSVDPIELRRRHLVRTRENVQDKVQKDGWRPVWLGGRRIRDQVR